jgi:hypothetical protein
MQRDSINLQSNLTPSYDENLKIGVVIGTYGASPYVDLGLHFLKNVNKIDKILVHDDCSSERDKLQDLCKKYNVDFYSTPKNLWHKSCVGSIGDQNCFYEGLRWAKNNNLDILVKISRRLIPCFNWVDNLKQLVLESDGLTFSSFCTRDLFHFRTEMTAMNVNAWNDPYILNSMKWYIDNEFPVFAEFWNHELAKQIDFQNFSSKYETFRKSHFTGYKNSGYVHWTEILGTNRYTNDGRNKSVLWHMYNSESDYYEKSKEIFGNKYSLNDFKNIVNI